MAQIHISKDPSKQTAVAFDYEHYLATKVKALFSLESPYSENMFQVLLIRREGRTA